MPKPKKSRKPSKEQGLLRIDPEDKKALKGKSQSYIMGWNKVKCEEFEQCHFCRKPITTDIEKATHRCDGVQ